MLVVHTGILSMARDMDISKHKIIGTLARCSALLRMNSHCKWEVDLPGFATWQESHPLVRFRDAIHEVEELRRFRGLYDFIGALAEEIKDKHPVGEGSV